MENVNNNNNNYYYYYYYCSYYKNCKETFIMICKIHFLIIF